MSAYQTLKFKINGASPFSMHNGRLCDPLDPHSQSIAELNPLNP